MPGAWWPGGTPAITLSHNNKIGAPPMQVIAFPMRLRENGLLERDSQSASLMQLLQVMARTPAGTWAACPEFGLRDLFEDQRLRSDVARLAMERINRVFVDLGLGDFTITEIVREIS